MTRDELREKLEDSDFDVVYHLWELYCYQELPDKETMIDDLLNYVGATNTTICDDLAVDDMIEYMEGI